MKARQLGKYVEDDAEISQLVTPLKRLIPFGARWGRSDLVRLIPLRFYLHRTVAPSAPPDLIVQPVNQINVYQSDK